MDFNRLLASRANRSRAVLLRFADRDISLTGSDLLDLSGPYCTLYRQYGLEPGDRVALWMGNVPEYALAYTAALRMGLVTVPVSVYEDLDKVHAVYTECGCSLLLYDSGNRFVRSALEKGDISESGIDAERFSSVGGIRLPSPQAEQADPSYDWDDGETNCIMYTSGSTGERKAIRKSVSNSLGARSTRRLLRGFLHLTRLYGGVNFYNVCPWYHNTGNCALLLSLCLGNIVQTVSEYFNPVHTARYLGREQPNIWLGTSTMLYRVCCANPDKELVYPSIIFFAGEAMSGNTLQTVSRQKGCKLLMSYYGTTETGHISVLIRSFGRQPLRYRLAIFLFRVCGFFGKTNDPGDNHSLIARNVDVRIRDDKGRLLPDGEMGEIYIRKAGITDVNPDGRNGEISTGDLGCKRGRRLCLLGRKKELIIRSGENIIPSEIEEKLLACPGVEEAVVCGVPSPDHGEDVCACLRLGPAADLDAIRAQFRNDLPRFMVPQHYLVMDSFLYNASGKTDRKRIAAEAEARLRAADGR